MKRIIMGVLLIACSGYTAVAQKYSCDKHGTKKISKIYPEKQEYSYNMGREGLPQINYMDDDGMMIVSYDARITTVRITNHTNGTATESRIEKTVHMCDKGSFIKESDETITKRPGKCCSKGVANLMTSAVFCRSFHI